MRYIIIILFGLSLPAIALESSASHDVRDTGKIFQQKVEKNDQQATMLQEKIQRKIVKKQCTFGKCSPTCDPEKSLHIPPFN